MEQYNTTQLHPEFELTKHVFHRDQFAHLFRWAHVLKTAKIGCNVLDFGCGNANLLQLLWRNGFKPNDYLGVDIRERTIKINQEKYKDLNYARFSAEDLCGDLSFGGAWDIIVCFEVIEHIGHKNVIKFLSNIKSQMNENTVLLISTPCYDARSGAANNHIINGEVAELTFNEMKVALEETGFKIEKIWGTFASQRDYEEKLPENIKEVYTKLKEYYDPDTLSILMAPLVPEYSRNCIWRCSHV